MCAHRVRAGEISHSSITTLIISSFSHFVNATKINSADVSEDKRRDKRRAKEKCTKCSRWKCYAIYGSGNGGVTIAHVYVKQMSHKRGLVFFPLFHIFHIFVSLCASSLFFLSFPARSRLLYYFVTGLTWLFIFFLFYFLLFPLSPFTILTFFSSSFAPFSFIFVLFVTNHSQRGIRTLDFSTTKLENKRRNVSHQRIVHYFKCVGRYNTFLFTSFFFFCVFPLFFFLQHFLVFFHCSYS